MDMERLKFDSMLTEALPSIERIARVISYQLGAGEWRDASQDAVLKMLTHCDTFDEARGSLLTWAAAIIRNAFTDAYRRTWGTSFASVDEARNIDSGSDIVGGIQARHIYSSLCDEARLYADGYGYAEICAKLGHANKSSVNFRINRCADSLRRKFGLTLAPGRRERMVAKAG